ncbi:hypothetical protein, partial [Streptomyces sp. MK7]|uniref:hypothetical protein n=1 Tax=Streptomyces sp. MK7 TaxID=3067635 RepID=UPI00292F320E
MGLVGFFPRRTGQAVAEPPGIVDQLVEQVRGDACDFFECGADGLGDQLQAGQVTYRGQDVGGIGALRGALAHESGLLEAGQCKVEETVGTVVFSETIAEV